MGQDGPVTMRSLAVLGLPAVLLLSSCTTAAPGAAPSAASSSVVPAPTASLEAPASSSATATTVAPSSPAPASPAEPSTPASPPTATVTVTTTAQAGESRPGSPQTMTLGIGQTARLTYFDVTVQRFAFGQDHISIGFRIEVCYRKPHAGAAGDGTTRVSTDPWSFLVRDGEGPQTSYKAVPVSTFPRDWAWSPSYRETRLAPGSCNVGWIGIRHENPDLQWGGIVYAPADFGDRITWRQ